MQAKRQQRQMQVGRRCAHTDVQLVSTFEDKMHLRSFDSGDGKVSEQRKEETEREGGGGEHIAEGRQKEKEDEEDGHECCKHR